MCSMFNSPIQVHLYLFFRCMMLVTWYRWINWRSLGDAHEMVGRASYSKKKTAKDMVLADMQLCR
jgi:hypothetical protein